MVPPELPGLWFHVPKVLSCLQGISGIARDVGVREGIA